MCRHFPDAKVTVRSVCCRKFFDCPQCHSESETHPLKKTLELTMVCKNCKRAFRKDLHDFDPETDSFCPHCDTEFVMASETSMAEPVPPVASAISALSNLDARMIRDEDITAELLGLEQDQTTRLG